MDEEDVRAFSSCGLRDVGLIARSPAGRGKLRRREARIEELRSREHLTAAGRHHRAELAEEGRRTPQGSGDGLEAELQGEKIVQEAQAERLQSSRRSTT